MGLGRFEKHSSICHGGTISDLTNDVGGVAHRHMQGVGRACSVDALTFELFSCRTSMRPAYSAYWGKFQDDGFSREEVGEVYIGLACASDYISRLPLSPRFRGVFESCSLPRDQSTKCV